MLSILRRHSLSRIQYGIVNPKIYHGKNDVKHDPQLKTVWFVLFSIHSTEWEMAGLESSYSINLTIKMY